MIRKLAQKSYEEKNLRLAEKRLSQIRRITKDFDDEEFEKIFLNEHGERQKLIHPVEPTWEQQLKEWYLPNGIFAWKSAALQTAASFRLIIQWIQKLHDGKILSCYTRL